MNLKRELGLLHIFCIASGAMISSGLFILPGLAFARAGPAVILSYFLAGLLSMPGMLSLAEMTTAMPKAGGDCFTIIRSMGPGVGTVAGLLSWFSLAMKSAFALAGMSIFTVMLVDIDIRLIGIFFALVFVGINLIGIKEAGRTQVVMVVGLLVLMLFYIFAGIPSIRPERFSPFASHGAASVFFATGFVFVSYTGLLKIASVAEEIKEPTRNIPLGMILSLSIVSVLYSLMVLVTVGVVEPQTLSGSMTPITDGAKVFLNSWGGIAMSIAAVLAFLSTANAGIMTAARSLIPLSEDGLLPGFMGRVNARFRTPHNALLITGGLILISLFLKLDILVEGASVVLILTNILACVSVIILRESRIHNYQPKFRTPFYPWMQIAGIAGFAFVLVEMGKEALAISGVLILAALMVYWLYGRIRANREYAMLHLIERVTSRELTSYTLESELREIIRQRDEIVADRFDKIIESCVVLDIERSISMEEFFRLASKHLSGRLGVKPEVLFDLLVERERQSSTVIMPELAIPHIIVEGSETFDVLFARCKNGIRFSEEHPDVQKVFVLAGSKDERNFHLQAISAIAQIVQDPSFDKRCMSAKGEQTLRDVILLSQRKRQHG